MIGYQGANGTKNSDQISLSNISPGDFENRKIIPVDFAAWQVSGGDDPRSSKISRNLEQERGSYRDGSWWKYWFDGQIARKKEGVIDVKI